MLHHIYIITLVAVVDSGKVFQYRRGVLHNEGYHQNDREHIEEPRPHEPRQRMPLIVGGEEGEYLAAHEEEEPDAQLQQEARELGTLEVFMPLAGGADARPQLQEQDEHHRHGEYGPQSKHGADAAQHG